MRKSILLITLSLCGIISSFASENSTNAASDFSTKINQLLQGGELDAVLAFYPPNLTKTDFTYPACTDLYLRLGSTDIQTLSIIPLGDFDIGAVYLIEGVFTPGEAVLSVGVKRERKAFLDVFVYDASGNWLYVPGFALKNIVQNVTKDKGWGVRVNSVKSINSMFSGLINLRH